MSEVRLKPCPFCGSVESLKIASAMDMEECENFEQCGQCSYLTIVCDFNKGGCGATSGFRISEEKAIEAWNRRA